MKILPIAKVSVNPIKPKDSVDKMQSLPKSVEVKQDFSNPTFKDCGAQQAVVIGGCSTFGIT